MARLDADRPIIIDFPFQPEWQSRMESGQKTCTSRPRTFGRAGLCFVKWGKVYIIVRIEGRRLDDIAANLYKEEGCANPGEFIAWWERLHPKKGWCPNEVVVVHHFMLLEKYGPKPRQLELK